MNSDDKLGAIIIVSIIFFILIMAVLYGGDPDLQDGIIKYLSK